MFLPPRSMISKIERNGGRIRWSEYGPRLDVPELVVSPAEFDFPQATLDTRRIYIGSCVEVSRSDGTFDWSWRDTDKPLLYCSLGTYSHVYQHARRLFDAVIAALRRREDMQAIVQVGSCAEIDAFGALPTRIQVVKHSPQIEILAHANVFITHGGLSSVREAIHCGVPMLVFPCWNDQPGNAARIVHHGIGLSGNIATVDMSIILRLLSKIAAPGFMDNIHKMQAVFRAQEDCQAGVDYIENRVRAA
jgi:MGT family glycosyltransferase